MKLKEVVRWILNNYHPKGRWIVGAAKMPRREASRYISSAWYLLVQLLNLPLKFHLSKLSRNEKRFWIPSQKQWISKDIPSYGSQSKRSKFAIHWFGEYQLTITLIWFLNQDTFNSILFSFTLFFKSKDLLAKLFWRCD